VEAKVTNVFISMEFKHNVTITCHGIFIGINQASTTATKHKKKGQSVWNSNHVPANTTSSPLLSRLEGEEKIYKFFQINVYKYDCLRFPVL
jgi:hypothetical protein